MNLCPLVVLSGNVSKHKGHLQVASCLPNASNLRIRLKGQSPGSLRRQLERFLYMHYHAGDATILERQEIDDLVAVGARVSSPAFLRHLRESNPGLGYASPGWAIVGRDASGNFFIKRDGFTLYAVRGKHIHVGAKLGDVVSIRFSAEAVHALPGFYIAFGDAGPAKGQLKTRFYVNLKPTYAGRFLSLLSKSLNSARIAFTIKTLTEPAAFSRVDNTVVYVARDAYSDVRAKLVQIRHGASELFRDTVPSLALALGPGMAVADDPVENTSDGEWRTELSFGQHRMRLVASAIARTALARRLSAAAVYAAIRLEFEAAGLDPDKPYLRSQTAVDYDDASAECEAV